MATDPVCGMLVDPASAAASVEFQGIRVYFCSTGCQTEFLANPAAFAADQAEPAASCCAGSGHHAAARPGAASIAAATAWGTLAAGGLLALYFGLLGGLSGWAFTLDQFRDYWPYIVALAAGFGAQVGLFAYLRRAVRRAQAGKVVAVSGTASGTAMVSCCAHYAVNLLPALGATGLVSLVGQYQVQLFWVGIAANLAGLAYIARRLTKFAKGA